VSGNGSVADRNVVVLQVCGLLQVRVLVMGEAAVFGLASADVRKMGLASQRACLQALGVVCWGELDLQRLRRRGR
jgi:hypothetical protein